MGRRAPPPGYPTPYHESQRFKILHLIHSIILIHSQHRAPDSLRVTPEVGHALACPTSFPSSAGDLCRRCFFMRSHSMSKRSKLPPSEARLAANRANAKKSTGPTTPAGKLRSAANACQHGFAGSNFAVARLEDPGEIDKFKADLVATYHPVNSQEIFAIESIAIAQQSMRRASRLESGVFTACLNEAFNRTNDKPLVTLSPDMIATTDQYGDIERCSITRAQNRNYGLGEGFHRFAKQSDTWRLFLRYQAQTERNYRRAKADLQELISMRGQLAIGPEVCEQPPGDPDPVLTPYELNPVRFPILEPPFPNEPTVATEPVETKAVPTTEPPPQEPPADPAES
jgi:hypothetical protein